MFLCHSVVTDSVIDGLSCIREAAWTPKQIFGHKIDKSCKHHREIRKQMKAQVVSPLCLCNVRVLW